jgi:hypothetical protein
MAGKRKPLTPKQREHNNKVARNRNARIMAAARAGGYVAQGRTKLYTKAARLTRAQLKQISLSL